MYRFYPQYLSSSEQKGIYTDTPKTDSSVRIIKIPEVIIEKLREYKKWQDEYKISMGSKWIEHDRLFTKVNGEPMGLRSPYKFYEKFCERTGLRFVNIHSFRHFNASIMIVLIKIIVRIIIDIRLGNNKRTDGNPSIQLRIINHRLNMIVC